MNFKLTKTHIFIAVLCMISIFIGVLGGATYYKLISTDLLRQNEYENIDDTVNILVAGVDTMENFADTLILVTVDTPAKEIILTSIPSDTMVNVENSTQKIGSLWSIGKGEMLKSYASKVTKKNVHNYVVFDFVTLAKTFDIVGGVEFDVPYDMHYTDKKQKLEINFQKGTQKLSGEDCVKILRYKPDDEASRVELQNMFIKAFLSQMSTEKMVSEMPAILTKVIKNVTTDFSKYSINRYVQIIKSLEGDAEIITKTLTGGYETVNDISYFVAD